VADPAGSHKSQHTEQTAFDILSEEGFYAIPAPSNQIQPRLHAVERLFRQTILGEPAVQIAREGCPNLIQALGNKYRYRKKRDGNLEETPEKLHPWSDLADCLQYMCMGVSANVTGRVMRRMMPRVTATAQITVGGWT
jgi:hypothetical protein